MKINENRGEQVRGEQRSRGAKQRRTPEEERSRTEERNKTARTPTDKRKRTAKRRQQHTTERTKKGRNSTNTRHETRKHTQRQDLQKNVHFRAVLRLWESCFFKVLGGELRDIYSEKTLWGHSELSRHIVGSGGGSAQNGSYGVAKPSGYGDCSDDSGMHRW